MNRDVTDFDEPERFERGGGLAEQILAVRRRVWPMLIAFCLVLLTAAAAALLLPPTYHSSGTILIEQQEVPLDFVRSAVSSFADERVEVISQRVMTTSNLGAILDKHQLYPEDRASMTREQLIERMREHVTREMISAEVVDPRAGRTTEATIAFAVGFESPSPDIAARVANDLVTLYLQKNLETRRQMAASTTQFLSAEADRLLGSISDIEQRLADFKARNYDRLPEFAQANAQLLARLNDDLQLMDGRTQALDRQIAFFESQLTNLSPRAPSMSSDHGNLSPADRLRAVREQYVGQLALYTPRHPTLASLKRELQSLEMQVGGGTKAIEVIEELEAVFARISDAQREDPPDAAELQRLDAEAGVISDRLKNMEILSATPAGGQRVDNPAYLSMQGQLEAAQSEREALNTRRSEVLNQIAQTEQRQGQVPEVERVYSGILRELRGEQEQYAEVRQKLLDAQLSQTLESEQKGERFTLIEPPVRQGEPIRPNRVAIFGIGFVLALGAAVAILVLLEAVDTRIRGQRQLELLIGRPPIAIIPYVVDQDARSRFWRRGDGAQAA